MSIKLARRYAIHAQLEMDRCDAGAIDEAIRWATLMLGALFDAKKARDEKSMDASPGKV